MLDDEIALEGRGTRYERGSKKKGQFDSEQDLSHNLRSISGIEEKIKDKLSTSFSHNPIN